MTELSPVADLTVELVGGPKPGKKMGYVKDKSGQFYSIFPEMLGRLAQGMTCKVEYTSRTADDGKEWRTIKKIIGGDLAPKIPPFE